MGTAVELTQVSRDVVTDTEVLAAQDALLTDELFINANADDLVVTM